MAKATKEAFEKIAYKFGQDTAVANWYAIDGRNLWQDYDTVVIYGLPYMDSINPLVSILAFQDWNNKHNKKDDPILLTEDLEQQASEYEVQLRIVKLIQAINRVRCRKTIDSKGNCDKTDVYLFLNNERDGRKIIDAIKQQMPEIRVSETHDAETAKIKETRSSFEKDVLAILRELPRGIKCPVSKVLDEAEGSISALRRLLRKYHDKGSMTAKKFEEMGVEYKAGYGAGAVSYFIKS